MAADFTDHVWTVGKLLSLPLVFEGEAAEAFMTWSLTRLLESNSLTESLLPGEVSGLFDPSTCRLFKAVKLAS
jgi:hypothetical protein